jgi:hypothetical protein
VVWDHADTKVRLTKGSQTIAVAAKSLDGHSMTTANPSSTDSR